MTRLLEKRLQRRQGKEVMLGDLVYSPEQIAKCNNCHVGQPGGQNPSSQERRTQEIGPIHSDIQGQVGGEREAHLSSRSINHRLLILRF